MSVHQTLHLIALCIRKVQQLPLQWELTPVDDMSERNGRSPISPTSFTFVPIEHGLNSAHPHPAPASNVFEDVDMGEAEMEVPALAHSHTPTRSPLSVHTGPADVAAFYSQQSPIAHGNAVRQSPV